MFLFAVLATVLSLNNVTYAQTVEEVAFYTCTNMRVFGQDVTIKPYSFKKTANGNEEIRLLFPPVLAGFTCPGNSGVTGSFLINQWGYRYIRFKVEVRDVYLYTDFADRYLNKRINVSIQISRMGTYTAEIVYY